MSPRFPLLGIVYLAVIGDLADMQVRDDAGFYGYRTGGPTVDCESWQTPGFRMLEGKEDMKIVIRFSLWVTVARRVSSSGAS